MEVGTPNGWARAFATVAVAVSGAACTPDDALRTEERASLAVDSHSGRDNQPPVVREVRIEPGQPNIGDLLQALATVRDAEGDDIDLSYRWSIDGEVAADSGDTFKVEASSKGSDIEVRVTASDGFAGSEPVSAWVQVIDRAPVINGLAIEPTDSVYPGDSVVVTPTASDADGDFVSFEFEWFVNGESVSTGEERSFSSEGLEHGDKIRVSVVASDGSGESRPLESEDVVVGSAHPEFVSTPPGITDAGVFRYPVEVQDPDGDRNLRYRLAAAPAGMKIDEVLGVIEWRPSEEQVGVHPVSVVVSDSTRLETTQSFEITVSGPGPAKAESAQE